jgi:hypothetical protein
MLTTVILLVLGLALTNFLTLRTLARTSKELRTLRTAMAQARYGDHSDDYLEDDGDCNTEELEMSRHIHREGFYKGFEEAFKAVEYERNAAIARGNL